MKKYVVAFIILNELRSLAVVAGITGTTIGYDMGALWKILSLGLLG
jgi:hypothetical protein